MYKQTLSLNLSIISATKLTEIPLAYSLCFIESKQSIKSATLGFDSQPTLSSNVAALAPYYFQSQEPRKRIGLVRLMFLWTRKIVNPSGELKLKVKPSNKLLVCMPILLRHDAHMRMHKVGNRCGT